MKPFSDILPRLMALPLLAGALALGACGGDDAAEAGSRGGSLSREPAVATADTASLAGHDVVADEPAADPVVDAAPAPAAERPSPGGGAGPGSPDGGAGEGGLVDGAVGGGGAEVGPAEPQETVEEVLRATARRYEDVRSLQAEFRQRLTNTLLGRTTESAGTLYQRQPDRFLMRFSDPAGDIIVSDGEYFWLYYPSADPRQVIRSRRGAGGLDLRSQFVGDPVRRFEATSQGTEVARGRTAHVITLDPREPVGYRRLKVWIDAEDHLVRRFELTEENGNVRLFDLTDLRVNPTLPDDLFRFEPPEGAVVVTR